MSKNDVIRLGNEKFPRLRLRADRRVFSYLFLNLWAVLINLMNLPSKADKSLTNLWITTVVQKKLYTTIAAWRPVELYINVSLVFFFSIVLRKKWFYYVFQVSSSTVPIEPLFRTFTTHFNFLKFRIFLREHFNLKSNHIRNFKFLGPAEILILKLFVEPHFFF